MRGPPGRWRNGVMNTGEAYITGTGAFLPGDPVTNEELAARCGRAAARDARMRERALAANGIRARHYATDAEGRTVMLNEELAERAVRAAIADRGLPPEAVAMLAAGTTQGDLLVPGFASMVHGRLGGGPAEVLSAGGVCASGMAALRAVVSAVRLGEHPVGVVVGSELASRPPAAGDHGGAGGPADPPDVSFLRWTLSDGAGAVVVEPRPRPDGLSLRVDWLRLVSHAHDHPVCMSAGLRPGPGPGAARVPRPGGTWRDRPAAGECWPADVPPLRQDMAALPALLDLGVAEYGALVAAGRLDPATEHVLVHYSAEHFRGSLLARLRDAGHEVDEARWFTNLHTAGNTGAASIFVMLDAARSRFRPGDRVLLVVPESGRFTLAFAHLTCVAPGGELGEAELAASPLGMAGPDDGPAAARALRELAAVWADFSRALSRVPVVARVADGTATAQDYRALLLGLRQQVIDGGRWISLAAANFSPGLFWLRSAAIAHAADEHRDFQMLERDFAAAGGDPALMTSTSPNIGSRALSAFMFHQAGQPDPVDLLGAMFIIEGLGARKAAGWAARLAGSLGLRDDQLTFLRYHAAGDDGHLQMLAAALRSGMLGEADVTRIVATARVTARLYALQLEELGNA
jgi:3-oxoacyl-[acyl-carrier-protein] synthase III